MSNLYFSNNAHEAKQFARYVTQGKFSRIYQGVYTDAKLEEIAPLLQSKWYEVVSHFCKNPIIVYRSAYEFKLFEQHIFVMSEVKKTTKISVTSALTIVVYPILSNALTDDFGLGLRKSNFSRQLLENLSQARSTAKVKKTLGRDWVEQQLCKELAKNGESALNHIRDQVKQFAPELKLNREAKQLEKMISALLSTHSITDVLFTNIAKATAKKLPFDEHRIELFKALATYLKQCDFKKVDYQYSKTSWRNFSFFESYFSNYIEGTEFEIDEAEDIVFGGKIIDNRNSDSHDVLSVYELVSDHQVMIETPQTAQEFIQLLKERHQLMMAQRVDVNPGEFKTKNNKAGDSVFVSPMNLEGTLLLGFEEYLSLPKGLARAIYIQYLISECHPFNDGNGRLSRIMMNAELKSDDQYKIIVPTVHRDSYLNGLRKATRMGKFRVLVKVFFQLQQYAGNTDWEDYGDVREQLELHGLHKLPDEGVGDFNRQLVKFKMDYPVE